MRYSVHPERALPTRWGNRSAGGAEGGELPAGQQACILPALSCIAQGPPMAKEIQNSGQGIVLGMSNGNFRVLPKSPCQTPTPLGVSWVPRPPLPSCHPHSVPYLAHPFPAVLKCHLRSNMASGMEHVGLRKRPHQVPLGTFPHGHWEDLPPGVPGYQSF